MLGAVVPEMRVKAEALASGPRRSAAIARRFADERTVWCGTVAR